MKNILLILISLNFYFYIYAKEYHVAKNGNDKYSGTKELPFLTIQAAADIAQPGDIIIVHRGIYREHVNPQRGGTSEDKRIVYQAVPGEKVEIRGSEIIKEWFRFKDNTWKVVIPNSFFGEFNPYKDLITGDWFFPGNREHHSGQVFLKENETIL